MYSNCYDSYNYRHLSKLIIIVCGLTCLCLTLHVRQLHNSEEERCRIYWRIIIKNLFSENLKNKQIITAEIQQDSEIYKVHTFTRKSSDCDSPATSISKDNAVR